MSRALIMLVAFAVHILMAAGASAKGEYDFDLSEIEKKPYTFSGFIEAQPTLFGLDRDAILHNVKLFDRDEGRTLEEYDLRLRLEGSYQQGIAQLYLRADTLLTHDYLGWDEDFTLQEGYLSLKPQTGFTLEAGKRAAKWGKGYAFNPVAFIDRPKNPEDPEEALEGFYMLTGEWIKSLDGPVTNLALTGVVLPATDDFNDEFGETDHVNFAGKLYLLAWDTDLDFLLYGGGSRPDRFGVDFSRNLRSNFEIHGELAWIPHFQKRSVDTLGNISAEKEGAVSGLVGLRYLTANDITLITEYYHNGTGFRQSDLESFYGLAERSYLDYLGTGNARGMRKVSRLLKETFARPNPMRDYLYLRASQKEPFDILYLTPAASAIVNLHDGSLSLAPEVTYSPLTNMEIRLRGLFPIGGKDTEYGEKYNDYRFEVRVRYFF